MASRLTSNNVRVITPCAVDDGALRPEAPGVSYCGDCRKHVYELAKLPQAEGRRLLRDGGCFEVRYDDDGAVVFADSAPPRPSHRRRQLQLLVAAAVAAPLWTGCSSNEAIRGDVASMPLHSENAESAPAPSAKASGQAAAEAGCEAGDGGAPEPDAAPAASAELAKAVPANPASAPKRGGAERRPGRPTRGMVSSTR